MQQQPRSANTKAPGSKLKSLDPVSLVSDTVNPEDVLELPQMYTPFKKHNINFFYIKYL